MKTDTAPRVGHFISISKLDDFINEIANWVLILKESGNSVSQYLFEGVKKNMSCYDVKIEKKNLPVHYWPHRNFLNATIACLKQFFYI